jgi:hypothetical protein
LININFQMFGLVYGFLNQQHNVYNKYKWEEGSLININYFHNNWL